MSAYSVKKPITVLMGILIVMVLGIFSVTRLPLTLFPDINLPFVVTITTYEGSNPEQVEQEVSRRIESTVSTIGNFKEVSSMSNEHFGVSIITFAEGTNMDSVVIEMRELLDNITFADGVGNPRIMRISPDMLPVMRVTMFRTYEEELSDEEQLIRNTEWINKEIMTTLRSIPGVADVSLSGEADILLEVKLDEAKLTQYGLTNQAVLGIIENQNVGGLVGVALDNGDIRMLYLGNKPTNINEMKTLPITTDNQTIVRLEDLAIEEGIRFINANTNTYSKINGRQGIQISFQKQSDVGITEVTRDITTTLNQIVAQDDFDADYLILLDQGEYITQSINSVLQNIIFGGLLAIIILFIFLWDIKPTIIVGLAIPISVVAAFMLMYFTNVSLNLISMGGLALGIGMLVDNAVVVIENIFRLVQIGKSKTEAAIEGAKQVAGAITASTLTTIAVFLPIAFIEGFIADIFINMALTIAYSLGASLIIALTLVPTMASRFLSDKNDKPEGKIMARMKDWYTSSVLFTLKHKVLTLLVVFGLLIGSFWIVQARGFILLPASDEGSISVSIDVSSRIDFTTQASFADYVGTLILDMEDVETVSATIGGSSMGGGPFAMMGGSSGINFSILLRDNREMSTEAVARSIEQQLSSLDFSNISGMNNSDILELNVSAQSSTSMIAGSGGIQIKVSGYDLLTLEAIANDLVAILETTPGVVKADNGINQAGDNVKITVNRDNAMLLGLTNQDVLNNLNYFYQNLGALGQVSRVTVTLEGIDYVLDIPEDSTGGFNFDLLGDYQTFLGGMMLFDQATQALIDAYIEAGNAGIYVPNVMLPTYQIGTPIQFVVNPFLKVGANGIELNPFSADPTLVSLAVSPLVSSDEQTSVTTVEKVTGFARINTDGQNRYVNVTAQIESGKNITLVSQEAISNVNRYLNSEDYTQYGGGYSVVFAGENEEIMSAVTDLALAALVAILLVYMVMAIQFQSLIYPFIILGTIPLAFTGGLIAVIISGDNLSMVSIMGLIILIGIVVNNGIVLIDYINKLRDTGLTVKDAIVEAGRTRLRPIFMTALTTILALAAMAIGIGEGGELLAPMAITAIGGLIYATLLTLVVVPTIYALFNSKKMKEEAKNHATS